MAPDSLTRRRLFGATLAVGAAALAARPAKAIRIEDANADQQALYMAACETQAAHEQLARELVQELEGQEGHDKALAIVAGMNCPYCGCKLAAIAPYDAKF
jgi:hypothetical protein